MLVENQGKDKIIRTLQTSRGLKEKNGEKGKIMHTNPIEVQKALKGMDYPAKKEDLVRHAKERNASDEVMQDINELPDKEYTNAADVSKEFKGD